MSTPGLWESVRFPSFTRATHTTIVSGRVLNVLNILDKTQKQPLKPNTNTNTLETPKKLYKYLIEEPIKTQNRSPLWVEIERLSLFLKRTWKPLARQAS